MPIFFLCVLQWVGIVWEVSVKRLLGLPRKVFECIESVEDAVRIACNVLIIVGVRKKSGKE